MTGLDRNRVVSVSPSRSSARMNRAEDGDTDGVPVFRRDLRARLREREKRLVELIRSSQEHSRNGIMRNGASMSNNNTDRLTNTPGSSLSRSSVAASTTVDSNPRRLMDATAIDDDRFPWQRTMREGPTVGSMQEAVLELEQSRAIEKTILEIEQASSQQTVRIKALEGELAMKNMEVNELRNDLVRKLEKIVSLELELENQNFSLEPNEENASGLELADVEEINRLTAGEARVYFSQLLKDLKALEELYKEERVKSAALQDELRLENEFLQNDVSRHLAELNECLQQADEERVRLTSVIVDKEMEVDALKRELVKPRLNNLVGLDEAHQKMDRKAAPLSSTALDVDSLKRELVDPRLNNDDDFKGIEVVEIEALKVDSDQYVEMILSGRDQSRKSSRGGRSDQDLSPGREEVEALSWTPGDLLLNGEQSGRVAELDERLQMAEEQRLRLQSTVLEKDGEIESFKQVLADLQLNDDVSLRLAELDKRLQKADEDRAQLRSAVIDRDAEIDILKRTLADIRLSAITDGSDAVMRADLVRSSSSRSEDSNLPRGRSPQRGFQDSNMMLVREEQERAVERARRTSRDQASLRQSIAAAQSDMAAERDDGDSLNVLELESVIAEKPFAGPSRTRTWSPERRSVLRDQERAIELAKASSSRRLSGRSFKEKQTAFRDSYVEDEGRNVASSSLKRSNDRSLSPSRQRVLKEQALAIERARSSSSLRMGRAPLIVTSPVFEEPLADGDPKFDRSFSSKSSSKSKRSQRASRSQERQQERSVQRRKRRFFSRLTWFGRSQMSEV